MRILAVVPRQKRTGASFYAEKLFARLPAEILVETGPILLLLSKLLRRDADVYHVQFEYRGFGSFPRSLIVLVFLTMLLRLKRPVVVTLHGLILPGSVDNKRGGRLSYIALFLGVRLTGLFASVFIVHSDLMRRVLQGFYRMDKVVVIPHGTDSEDLGSRRSAKSNSLVFFGFIRPSKGIENLIYALTTVRVVYPNIMLTVAGSVARPEEAAYLEYLHNKVQQCNLESSVIFRDSFLQTQERTRLLVDAVAVVLPYTDNFVEVSGVVHDLAEYGVPIICSQVPRFSELVNEFDCLKVPPSPTNVAAAILRILKDPDLRSRLGTNLQLRAKLQSWDSVAQQHLSLYQTLTSGRGLPGLDHDMIQIDRSTA